MHVGEEEISQKKKIDKYNNNLLENVKILI